MSISLKTFFNNFKPLTHCVRVASVSVLLALIVFTYFVRNFFQNDRFFSLLIRFRAIKTWNCFEWSASSKRTWRTSLTKTEVSRFEILKEIIYLWCGVVAVMKANKFCVKFILKQLSVAMQTYFAWRNKKQVEKISRRCKNWIFNLQSGLY